MVTAGLSPLAGLIEAPLLMVMSPAVEVASGVVVAVLTAVEVAAWAWAAPAQISA